MGLIDRIYEWRARNLEAKIKELESMKTKQEKKLEELISSGKVKPRLLETFKSMKEDIKDERRKSILEKSNLSESSKSGVWKEDHIRSLTSVKCRKVVDPYLYAETSSNEDVSLDNMNVSVYTLVDTREPVHVLDRNGDVFTQSKAPLRKDIYSIKKEKSENTKGFNQYELGYGIGGRFDGKPLEYLEVSRGDGSKFYIAERFARRAVGNEFGLREYSIKRYSREANCYKEDIIFSEGIDLARMISGDTEYISNIGNLLLTEKRIQKCLKTPSEVREREESDRILHGAGYVGHLEQVERNGVKGYRKKSEFFDFDALQAARETQGIYQGTESEICNENDVLRRMHPQDYSRSNVKKENVENLRKRDMEH